MKWSLTIARVFGIRIQVHFTYLLLLLWIVVEARAAAGWGAAMWGVAFIVATFTCVVLHELSHSVVAQRFGVKVSSITLLPIGGVAALRSIPQKPAHEIAITAAGPLMNVLIFAVLYAIGVWVPFSVPYYPGLMTLPDLPMSVGELIGALLLVNKWMIVFNLIPAYPMDGGRLLRAMLARWLPYSRATAVAAGVGQVISGGFVVSGLLTGWIFLVIIGVLIYFVAGAEGKTARLRGTLQNLEVGKIMTPVFVTIGPDSTVDDCTPGIFQRGQDDFPVLADGRLMGLLTRDAVLAAASRDGSRRAAELMTVDFYRTRPDAQVAEMYDVMQASGQRTVPVMDGDQLVGLLTLDNINRYFMFRSSGGTRNSAQI